MINSRDNLIGAVLGFIGDGATIEEKTLCREFLVKLTEKPTTQATNDPPPIVGN